MSHEPDMDDDDNDYTPRTLRVKRDKSTILIVLVTVGLLVIIAVMAYKIFTAMSGSDKEPAAAGNAAQSNEQAASGNAADNASAGDAQNGNAANGTAANGDAQNGSGDAPVSDDPAAGSDSDGTSSGAADPQTPAKGDQGATSAAGGKAGTTSPDKGSGDGQTSETSGKTVKLPTTYVVQKGDTLSSISMKFYQSKSHVSLLAEQNNIVFINDMKVGDTLKIPALSSESGSSPAKQDDTDYSKITLPVTYMIRAGDTLSNISMKFYRSKDYADLIAKQNKLEADGELKAGDSLTIPALPDGDKGGSASGGGPVAAAKEHTVQKGETLSSISRTYYNTSKYAKTIADYNHLEDGDSVKVGDVLKIPPTPTP